MQSKHKKRVILFLFFFTVIIFVLVSFNEGTYCFASTWAKSYGTSTDDIAYSVDLTSDGGYIVAGLTYGNFFDI